MADNPRYPLRFGALSYGRWSGEPGAAPKAYVIDPEEHYEATLYADVFSYSDPDLTCRVGGLEGAFWVEPDFEVSWDDPRFYGDWVLLDDGDAHLESVILVGDK